MVKSNMFNFVVLTTEPDWPHTVYSGTLTSDFISLQPITQIPHDNPQQSLHKH